MILHYHSTPMRERIAKKLAEQRKDFLERNPGVRRALRIFEISSEQYRKATQSNIRFYSSTSTNQ